jgi:ATP-dependent Clp protease ATP-binding subunit ClpC
MPNISIGLDFAWQIAATEARNRQYEFIEPEHLFIGVCKVGSLAEDNDSHKLELPGKVAESLRAEASAIAALFDKFHLDLVELYREVRQRKGQGNFVHDESTKISRSPASYAVFARAADLAVGASAVTTLHLCAALLENVDGLVVLLTEKSVDVVTLRDAALAVLSTALLSHSSTSLLNRFGKDLTQLAREGKIQECIGRREEILQVIRTLSRETKNNPVLVGDAGVGKTAIVEGLAWRIAQNKDKSLLNTRIIQLNVADLVAGTRYRGEFEERIQGIVQEVAQSSEVILFIDELHTLIGAGGAVSSLDAANILKPALARGALRCIGATTMDEYRKHIERDAALERRFQTITINEPTTDETHEILARGYKERFEKKYGIRIDAAALHAAVLLSVRYLPDRRLPDKAIDLLDEACARIAVPALSLAPGEESAGGLVTAETLAEVLATWTGIPVAQLTGSECGRLLRMADELQQRVIGQDRACAVVAQAVQRARAGLKPPGHPVAVLLFVGPTGVGKTELARATAAFLFGSDKAMVRMDMSEFMEKHTVSRLIGAPPGYIGYDEEGQLTGALRRTPFCVVLLDEVEKAHPDVLNLFLQVFDDGRLTDSKGRLVDASNAIFMMTSNLGYKPQPGPLPPQIAPGTIDSAIRSHFRSEFLNRIDDIIYFQPLQSAHMFDIVKAQLKQLRETLAARTIQLNVTDEAMQWLAQRGYEAQGGARPLARLIQKELVNGIGGLLLAGIIKPTHIVNVTVEGNALQISSLSPETI